MDGDLRLNVGSDNDYISGNTQYDDAYYIDETQGVGLIRGRVEVCSSSTQTWGSVCDDNWTNLDASVVCRQMGFSPYGANINIPLCLACLGLHSNGMIISITFSFFFFLAKSMCRCYCYHQWADVLGFLKLHNS